MGVEKRGVKVYVCDPNSQDKIPDDPSLHKIKREMTKHAYEHIPSTSMPLKRTKSGNG